MLPLLQWKISEYYTTSVCVFVNLGIQPAMRMCRIVICRLPRSTVFSTLSHKRHDFRKEVTENQMRAWIFSTNFV